MKHSIHWLAVVLPAVLGLSGMAAAQMMHAAPVPVPPAMGEVAAGKSNIAALFREYGNLDGHLVDHAAQWRSWPLQAQAAFVEGFRGAVAETATWRWTGDGVPTEPEAHAILYWNRYFTFLSQPAEQVVALVDSLYANPFNGILPVATMVDVAASNRSPDEQEARLRIERTRVLELAQHWYEHNHEM